MIERREQSTGISGMAIPPITVRVREACRLTGMGRSKLYMLIKEGHIDVVKVGAMTLIPMRSLEEFLGVPSR